MPISRLAKTTLAVLFWANFMNFLDRQIIAALAPQLKDYWQLSDYQVGLLATAFELAYALAPVPIALLADRWLRRRVVALALALWSGATALTGAAGSFGMLLVGRASLGLGEAAYGPSALAWLSDLFPPSHRSRAVGFHDLALMVGSAAGFALGGILATALGWRGVLYLAAAPGLLLAIVIWLLPEPVRGQSDYLALGVDQKSTRTTPATPVIAAFRELLATPTLAVTYVTSVLVNFSLSGVVFWMPSFVIRVHGLDEGAAGLAIGVLTVVAGAGGVICGGFVADRLLRRTPAGRLLTIALSYLAGFPLALGALLAPNLTVSLGLAALAVFFFTFFFPCLAPLIHQVTRPELRATAMSLYLLFAHVLGNAVAPVLIGQVSDRMGDLRLGLAAALLLALLGAAIGLWGTRFVSRDTAALRDNLQATGNLPG